jgi:WD40 repeat protein
MDGTVRIWYIKTGAPVAMLRCHSPVTALAFNPNPTRFGELYSGSMDGTLRFWVPTKDIPYLADVKAALKQHQAASAANANASLSASSQEDNGGLDVPLDASQQFQQQQQANAKANPMTQSQQLHNIADAEMDAELVAFSCQAIATAQEQVDTISVSPGGTLLVAGGAGGLVQFFTTANPPTKTQSIVLHDKKVTELSWSHSGDRLLTGSEDGSARVLEFQKGKWTNTLTINIPTERSNHYKPRIGSIGWSAKDDLIITGLHSKYSPIRVWDTRETEKVYDKNDKDKTGPYTVQPKLLFAIPVRLPTLQIAFSPPLYSLVAIAFFFKLLDLIVYRRMTSINVEFVSPEPRSVCHLRGYAPHRPSHYAISWLRLTQHDLGRIHRQSPLRAPARARHGRTHPASLKRKRSKSR